MRRERVPVWARGRSGRPCLLGMYTPPSLPFIIASLSLSLSLFSFFSAGYIFVPLLCSGLHCLVVTCSVDVGFAWFSRIAWPRPTLLHTFVCYDAVRAFPRRGIGYLVDLGYRATKIGRHHGDVITTRSGVLIVIHLSDLGFLLPIHSSRFLGYGSFFPFYFVLSCFEDGWLVGWLYLQRFVGCGLFLVDICRLFYSQLALPCFASCWVYFHCTSRYIVFGFHNPVLFHLRTFDIWGSFSDNHVAIHIPFHLSPHSHSHFYICPFHVHVHVHGRVRT